MTLRVATYNVHRSVGPDGRVDQARIVRVAEEVDADVLALQEVGYQPGDRGHLLELLQKATNAEVIEGVTLRDEGGHYGNALLSRLPVRAVRHLDISVPRREPRGAIDAVLDVGSTSVQVVATHLGLRPGERRAQVQQLLRVLESSQANTRVLLGDLNEWFLWGRPVRWLQRVFQETPAPATFPSRKPFFALDRLWVAPSQALKRIYVHDSEAARLASDHLPLVGIVEP